MDDELKTFYQAYMESIDFATTWQMSIGGVIADVIQFLLVKDENGHRVHDVTTILSQMDDYGLEDFAIKIRYACEGCPARS